MKKLLPLRLTSLRDEPEALRATKEEGFTNPSKKTAVILFNLGGPECEAAVKPFLFNLFNDKAIVTLPQPFRFVLAKRIAGGREKEAKHIYAQIGGKSPILEETQKQAKALEEKLGSDYKTFIAMRYWHPFAEETAREVKAYDPENIVLLPLYPQYSTTTTGSSIKDWQRAAHKAGITAPAKIIESYPAEENFIATHVELLKKNYEEAKHYGNPRILFSAHGLPQKTIRAGDPYQQQVEETVEKVVSGFRFQVSETPDHAICYQSKVGGLTWLEPSTEDEIRRAGKDKIPVVVVPIAFVSEHSETLVELDIQYRQLAQDCGVPAYMRVPALGAHPKFIAGLASLVNSASE